MNAFAAALRTELRKALRVPAVIIFTIGFPIMFFAMFGLANAGRSVAGINIGAYLMSSYGAYAMMAAALITFGASVSNERALGWNRLLRVTPLSSTAYIGAKIGLAVIVSGASLTSLFLFGFLVGKVSLPILTWLALGGVLLLGMLPFTLLGMAIGYAVSPAAAPPIVTIIYLPLSFASGLFMPLQMLPQAVQKVAPYLPSYHLGELGWNVIGAGDGRGMGPHLLWLAGYAAAFGAMALWAYRRDEGRQFG